VQVLTTIPIRREEQGLSKSKITPINTATGAMNNASVAIPFPVDYPFMFQDLKD